MPKILISFEKKNVRLGAEHWLFRRRQVMRFEWLALLGFKRIKLPADQAWVTVEEIAQLPSWAGRARRHVAANVARYLEAPELSQVALVAARRVWRGPYRLNADSLSVEFDIPLFEVRKALQIRPRPAAATRRNVLIRFTCSYERAQWLVFQGKLLPPREKSSNQASAYGELLGMADNLSYGTTLRLLACLSAADALYRLGRFAAARELLLSKKYLLTRMLDLALEARFHLKLAWAYQRAATGRDSDRAVEVALRKASSCAENSGDRDSLGLTAYRTAGYLTKKRRYLEAVNQYALALEAYLITGNHDMVHATCANLGSAMHRMGSKYYPEVRQWLHLSIAIARWMKLGRDDAHAEMILAKMYVENGERYKSHWLLKRAARIAERAGNRLNLADILMVWGLWHQRFGKREQLVETLARALRLFRALKEFDVPQKERYMEHKFSAVWSDVLECAGSETQAISPPNAEAPSPPRSAA